MAGKDVRYYRRLPYRRTVELRRDSDGSVYYLARIQELPSIRIHGQTREEALFRLGEIFDDLIESMIEEGVEIPEPSLWPAPFMTERQARAQEARRGRRRRVKRYRIKEGPILAHEAATILAPEGEWLPNGAEIDVASLGTAAV